MDRKLLVLLLIGAAIGCMLCALLIVTGVVASTHFGAFLTGSLLSAECALFVERV